MVSAAEIRRRPKETLGISKLRAGQLRAIKAVLAGRDTLAVMRSRRGGEVQR
jgi:superfamily II DNA helicase RecQ